MHLLVTGACGFVGRALIRALLESTENLRVTGLDSLTRAGSEGNRAALRALGVTLLHGDIRLASDVDALPAADWLLDCAANPSVLAGVADSTSSRQVVEHNLLGTVNLLEWCRRHSAGFLLVSTSRVYSIPPLAALPVEISGEVPAFRLRAGSALPPGVSDAGVTEEFSTAAPVSLYGATKLASEALALEYGASFGLPVRVNRCGVLAGAGQFGRADQGIVAFWINAWLRRAPLRYLGFGGTGAQVRDALHPRDLAALLARQIAAGADPSRPTLANVGGGASHAFSLAQLSAWCAGRFGFDHPVAADGTPRPLDIPWMLMDSARAAAAWSWKPAVSLGEIFEETAAHAEAHPGWLELSRG